MKTLSHFFASIVLLIPCLSSAQTTTSAQTTGVPAPTPYTVTSRGPSTRVWESTSYELLSSGEVVPYLEHYTEVASGLCYQQNGQWMDSQEQINILADGSAAATNGQHQAYFPPDIYNGVITLVTPDGLQLQSQPVGLSYDDGTNIVLIAQLTNSVGQLISSNQVIYTNAFVGVDADLLYTYRIGGLEQDVIFRGQPPVPEQFGLDSENARLQMLTEFFDAPTPAQTTAAADPDTGLQDTTLTFGSMKMTQGNAFLSNGDSQNGQIPVCKSWTQFDGRTFLVEAVPYGQIGPQLATLPQLSLGNQSPATLQSLGKVSPKRLLPPIRWAKATTNVVQFARTRPNRNPGLVFDYITINSGETNYTFQGDTTYSVSGEYYLYGTTIFEGGTVIKMNSSGKLDIDANGSVNCTNGPYSPVVFTSINDNGVGNGIGTGSPAMGDVNTFLNFNSTNALLHDCRFSYALKAISQINPGSGSSINIWDSQFKNVDTAVFAYNIGLFNVLIGRNALTNAAVIVDGTGSVVGENVTADYGTAFVQATNASSFVALTNCLVTSQPLLTTDSQASLSTNHIACVQTPSSPIYQVVGGASYYLTNSTYRGIGTADINSSLLADLTAKTTWPPFVFSNFVFSASTNFSPQALRDTNSSPDLGYHYDPLDYVFGGCDLHTNMTFTNGAAVGWFEVAGASSSQPYAIALDNGANLTCSGNATDPVYIARYTTVQEGAGANWDNNYWGCFLFNGSGSSPFPQLSANFSKWTENCGFAMLNDSDRSGTGYFKNSELYNVPMSTYGLESLYFTNCLFFRAYFGFWDQDYALSFNFLNCTFYNGCMSMTRTHFDSGYLSSFWLIENCSFDGTALAWNDGLNGNPTNTLFNYNAYNIDNLNWTNYPYPYKPDYGTNEVVGTNDMMLTSYNWESSWFGNFYLPVSSPILHKGSTNANDLGLYHFTTLTNQAIEGTNTVTIGYHYVATDTNGIPMSTPGDGIPDYLADINGNGIDDPGEIPWDIAILSQPKNINVAQGQNANFSVTVGGIGPFGHQWLLNSNAISDAYSSNYTALVVQPSQDGSFYSVIVSNLDTCITSSVAILSVSIPVILTNEPQSQTVVQGTNVSFNVGASGNYLQYQWYNSSGGINNGPWITGSTNSTLTLSNVVTADENNYYVTVSNAFDSVTSAPPASLTVITNPVISSISPYPGTNAIQSEDVMFIVTDSGEQTNQWWFSNSVTNVSIPYATGPSYTQLVVQTTNDGFYYVIASNLAGTTNDGATLNVLVPPWITNQPMSVVTNTTHLVTFSVGATGTTNLSYQWFENGTNALSGDTNSAMTWTAKNAGSAGGFSCVVSNVAGTSTSAWAWLSVVVSGVTNYGWGTNGVPPTPFPAISMIWPTNTSPTNPAIYPYGPPISIRALATSQYSYVTNVAFYFTGTNSGPGTNFTFAGNSVPGPDGQFALAWTNALPGTNILKAVATDYYGNTNVSTNLVYVIMTEPPGFTLPATTNLVWIEGATSASVWLSAVVTNDGQPDISVTNANWTPLSGVIFSSSNSLTTEITFPTNGVYPLSLRVDNGNATNQQTCTVYVRRRPQININSPTNGAAYTIGTPVVLNASATAISPDSTIENVVFYTNSVSLGTATPSITNSFTYLWVSSTNYAYSLTAVATDNYGLLSTSAPVTVTIFNPYPYVQITSPINLTSNAYSDIILNAFATNSTFAAPISWVEFYSNGHPIGFAISSNNVYQLGWMPTNAGTYVLTALATATNGLAAWSLPVTNFINGVPLVTISTPPNNSNLGSTLVNVPISANVTPAGAAITNVSFYADGVLIGTNLHSPSPYGMTWLNVPLGNYVLTATATDTNGAMGTSANVAVTVDQTNQPPFVYAGPTQITNMPTAQLSGLVSDDGLPSNFLSVAWSQISGPVNGTVTFGNSNQPSTTATFTTNGVFVLQLSADDGQLTNTSQVQITVYVTNSPPVVNAGPNQTVLLPLMVTTNPLQFQEIQPVETPNVWNASEDGHPDAGGLPAGGMDYLGTSNAIIMSVIDYDTNNSDENGYEYLYPNFYLTGTNANLSLLYYNATYLPDFTSNNPSALEPLVTAQNASGRFTSGETFCAYFYPGEIMRMEPDGTMFGNNPVWGVLTNSTIDETTNADAFVAAICLDQTGIWGGDVIAITRPGDVWRVNSSGQASLIAENIASYNHGQVEDHSSVTTIPGDVQKYGPWAGRILVSSDNQDGNDYNWYTIDTNGFIVVYIAPVVGDGLNTGGQVAVIPKDQNLYSWNSDGSLWCIPASQLQGMAGDIVQLGNLTDEYDYIIGGYDPLNKINWNGNYFNVIENQQLSFSDPWQNTFTFCPAGMSNIPSVASSHVQLNGVVNDDGRLFSPTSNYWYEVTGPGPMTFDNPTQTNTFAEFTAAGLYVLRLTAYDGQFTNYCDVEINVLTNQGLSVNAGTNQFIASTNAFLNGIVTDTTGISNQVALTWSQISGPAGGANFGWTSETTNLNTYTANVTNSVSFTTSGVYVLQVFASDGRTTSSNDVTISVETPYILLSPGYGWPTLTNTSFVITASLMDSNNVPVTNTGVLFFISGINGNLENPTEANGSNTTSLNGTTWFSYAGTNQGRDLITVSATIDGQTVTNAVEKDWASEISCDSTNSGSINLFVSDQEKWGWYSESLSMDIPANNTINFADYYVFHGAASNTITLTCLPDSSVPNLTVLLRDPSSNLVATANTIVSGTKACLELNYTLQSSGDYLIEVVNLDAVPNANDSDGLLGDYALGLSCNGDSNGLLFAFPQLEVLYNGTNITSGGTVGLSPTILGLATTNTLVLSNSGPVDLTISSIQTNNEEFLLTNEPVIVPAGGSTNLGIVFRASASGQEIGQFVLYGNIPVSGCYMAYLTSSPFSTGAPPAITITSPLNLAQYYAPAFISITAAISAGVTNITNVLFEALSPNGMTVIGTVPVGTTNSCSVLWQYVPNGTYSIFAVATDAAGRTTTSPSVSVQVLPITDAEPPPLPTNALFYLQVNSVNNVLKPLLSDYDPDSNTLAIVAMNSLPENGSAVIVDNGQGISYTPLPGYYSQSINGVIQPFDEFNCEISNGKGGTTNQTVVIYVYPDVPPSVIITNPPPSYPYPTTNGFVIPLTATITNVPMTNIASVGFYLNNTFIGEATKTSPASYVFDWTAVYSGDPIETITAQAFDLIGEAGESQPITVTVRPPTGITTASLDNFVGSLGSTQFNVGDLVTIRDGGFQLYGRATNTAASVTWQLQVYSADGSTLIRDLTPSSTGPVGTPNSSGLIMSDCDLTTLENGVYDLRLTVLGGGSEVSVDQPFILESNLKIGEFSFSQQDLVIPVNGIPLTVTRSYNSTDTHEGDFGYGWTYSLSDLNIALDETRTDVQDLGGNTFSMRSESGSGRDVTLTLPTGQRTTFYYNPRIDNSSGNVYPQWQAGPGITAKLAPGPNSAQVAVGAYALGGGQVYWQDPVTRISVPYEIYDFPDFILTMYDGTQYLVDRQDLKTHVMSDDTYGEYSVHAWGTPYLAEIIERNANNTISFNTNSIVFSSLSVTNQLLFQRNAAGLISSISDPNSIASGGPPAVKYQYDGNDNLIYVERLVNSSTEDYVTNYFFYENPNFPHFITSMLNGDGTQVAENFYDDTGKLTKTVDASGNTTYFNNNLTNNSEAVVDRMGNTNTYAYDTRGNIIVETDPLNETTTNYYDSLNNLLSTTDPLNNTTRYAYDSNGNRTQVVDALGNTNFFNYDGNGDLAGQTDPFGDTTTNFYDSAGDLTETEQLDTNGNIITESSSVYQNGQLTQMLNASNQVTGSFGYDPSSGNLTSATDANGLTRTFGYDADGNQTNSSYVSTAPNGSQVTVTNLTFYDGQNRVIMTIDANGNTNQTFYDLNGKVSYTIDQLGNTNSFLYDARGNQIQAISALGTTTYTVYDLDSRPILTTDPNGITGTWSQYDAAGRVTNVVRLENVQVNILPDANAPGQFTTEINSWGTGLSTNSTTYFANGWVKSRTSPDGTTTYAYYANGQTETVTDPLTNTTYYAYDTAGRQSEVEDALSHTTQFRYDAVGRQIKTIFNDTTSISNEFNSVGQRVGTVDQAGLISQFAYNVAGSLTNVIKPQVPLGTPSWFYQYNTNGQLVATTDPKGHTTTNFYDAQGRQLGQALPMGQVNTQAVYNAHGQLWKEYDFDGQMIEHRYDNFGRETNKYYFTAGDSMPSYSVSYAYNQLNQLTNVTQLYGSTVNSGYQPLARNGEGAAPEPMSAKLMATLNRNPNVSGGTTTLLMLGMALMLVPRKKRRRFVKTFEEAWRANLLYWDQALSNRKPEKRRLRMPSFFWRCTSIVTMLVVLTTQPGAYQLWTVHGQCVYPPNFSNSTTCVTTYSYDFDGHLIQVNSPEGVINYGYDLATGRMTLLCTTNSEQDYGYDALGRLLSVTVAKRNSVAVTNETTMYHYDAVGNRSEIDLPNGVVTTYKYDSLNRLTNMVHQFGTTTTTNLATYSYTLNATGRRTGAVEVLRQEDNTYQTNSLKWQYDGMYRLTNEINVTATSNGTYAYTNAYGYDLVGNRLQKSRSGASAETDTYTYNANDELTNEIDGISAINYLYDPNGSLTNQATGTATNSYTYDLANKLNGVSVNGTQQASYYYNDQGIRVQTSATTTGGTTYFLIDGNNQTGYAQVLEELPTVGGTPVTSYVIGDDVLAQCGSTSSSLYYFLQDGHGNNRQLLEMNGAVFSHYTYDGYGNVQTGTGSIYVSSTTADAASTTKLYCGEQYDSNLKMYDLRARFYDPLDGQFNQRDTFAGNNDDPQSLHKYLYSNCDPINRADPSGQLSLIEINFAMAIQVIGFSMSVAVLADAFQDTYFKLQFIQAMAQLQYSVGSIAVSLLGQMQKVIQAIRDAINQAVKTAKETVEELWKLPKNFIIKSLGFTIYQFDVMCLESYLNWWILTYNGGDAVGKAMTKFNRDEMKLEYSVVWANTPPDREVDEFPYATTQEGGPWEFPPALVQYVPSKEHRFQGGALSATYAQLRGRAGRFLNVPIPL